MPWMRAFQWYQICRNPVRIGGDVVGHNMCLSPRLLCVQKSRYTCSQGHLDMLPIIRPYRYEDAVGRPKKVDSGMQHNCGYNQVKRNPENDFFLRSYSPVKSATFFPRFF